MEDLSSPIQSPAQARWIAVVAVFGAVWGAAEITLGAILRHASIPMHGTLMTGIGIVIMLVARRMLADDRRDGRGVCLAIGIVAAAILPISVTRGILWALVGIVVEAACLEVVLWVGRPGRIRFALAAVLAALVPLVELLGIMAVKYGPATLSQFREVLLTKQGGDKLGLAGQTAGMILLLVVIGSAIYGAICGIIGWSLARQIQQRLGRDSG